MSTLGFEPKTNGLKDQCSTVELSTRFLRLFFFNLQPLKDNLILKNTNPIKIFFKTIPLNTKRNHLNLPTKCKNTT